MRRVNISQFLSLSLIVALFSSCSDWVSSESLDHNVVRPGDQNPELIAKYHAALRAYKESEHFISYAVFNNAPKVAIGEKDFMRCLPDSLDFVSLTNAANLSRYDLEDLAVMKSKGTKVLYQVDYSAKADDFTTATLGAYLDKVVADVAKHNLDGFAFSGTPYFGDDAAITASRAEAAALLVSKLRVVGKWLVFEGDPLFVASADRAKVDYYVLNTHATNNVTQIRLQLLDATDNAGVPESKLLLAAQSDFVILDEAMVEKDAIGVITNGVISYGPLAGIAIYGIDADYYGSDKNYPITRTSIQTLNPSK